MCLSETWLIAELQLLKNVVFGSFRPFHQKNDIFEQL